MRICFVKKKLRSHGPSVHIEVTTSHLLLICRLSSLPANGMLLILTFTLWAPGQERLCHSYENKTAQRKRSLLLLLQTEYSVEATMKVTIFPEQQRLSITLWEVYSLFGAESWFDKVTLFVSGCPMARQSVRKPKHTPIAHRQGGGSSIYFHDLGGNIANKY